MEVFETKTRLLYKAYERRLLPQGKLAGLQSGSLRKHQNHPFFLALRRWGRFAQRTSPASGEEPEGYGAPTASVRP